jgi:hypothetical protein
MIERHNAPRHGARRASSVVLALALSSVAAASAFERTAHAEPGNGARDGVERERSPQSVKDASVHFERGVKLFEDGDYKLSLVEFRRSYQSAPDYRTLYNIGEVEFQLGSFADARQTLQRYLEEGGGRIAPARRADVDRDLEALRIRTAYLRVAIDVDGAEVRIDGERIGTTPLRRRLLVNGGPHTITASKPGYLASSQDVALAGAEEKTVTLGLLPAPEDRPATSGIGPAWIGWGITGALVAGTAGLAVAWDSASSDLADTKSRPTTQAELDQKAQAVDTRRAITLSLGSAALVAAGISTYLTLARGNASPPSAAGRRGPAARISVSPGGLVGSF